MAEATAPRGGRGAPAEAAARLPRSVIVAYCLPIVGIGYVEFLFRSYLLKFTTEVLMMAPAVVGTVFFVARIWDGVSDPLAGYLSDRTRSRLGRRRPWLLASALPVALVAPLVWIPPEFAGAAVSVVWLAVGVLAFETASTAFYVPHAALGAELSAAYHERTRVFGFRQVAFTLGTVLGAGAVYGIVVADDKRLAAPLLVALGAAASAAFTFYAVARIREPGKHSGRGAAHPFPAIADIWRNPHARLLVIIYFIEFAGMSTLTVLGPFFTHYIVGDEKLYPFLLLASLGPAILFVPLVLRLSQRFGKKTLWLASMGISGLAFGALAFIPEGAVGLFLLDGVFVGIGFAISSTVGPSVQADIIDYDEYLTGERKEGTYFATWNLTRKVAGAVTVWMAGVALQVVGFEPGGEQSEATRQTIRLFYSAVPCVGFGVAMLVFTRFRLTEPEHRRIRAELDARHTRASE